MLKEFGQDLKKLRELKGISIAEISAESRINPKFLSNIENGIFDFQPEAYIRSFIKAYARALDENENQLLNEYDKAKAGFYARRKFKTDEPKDIIKPADKLSISVSEQPGSEGGDEKYTEPVYSKELQTEKPDYFKPKEPEPEKEFSNRSITQKVLLIVLILAVLAGVYFLVDYLNSSGQQQKTDVKPKTFNEISSEYENKLSGKKDTVEKVDSTQLAANDSLRLMVKAIKDIKIKVYVDENKLVEGDIAAKDSIFITAKERFRFSSTSSNNVELYLNGKFIRKPAALSGTSIKNLVINKDGIVSQ